MQIRAARPSDFDAVLELRGRLWPDHRCENLEHELRSFLADEDYGILVLADGSALRGFVEVAVRPHCNGCTTYPVGYLEGWYVDDGLRGEGHGRALVEAAERWAAGRGCREMGSDCHLHNDVSRAAHAALGFREHCRLIHFIKTIA